MYRAYWSLHCGYVTHFPLNDIGGGNLIVLLRPLANTVARRIT